MLLAFNTIITENYKIGFDEHTLPLIMDGFPYKIVHLGDEKLNEFRADEKVFSEYSHLLVTGSSLSASQGSDFDEMIIKVIQYFIKNQKPILGICHGHQMIARAIVGNDACRKTKTPEFGWKKMQIKDNPLFKGISNPVFLESHYDEVCNLSDDFNIIATNNECEVQFHPEMQFENGSEMVRSHLDEFPHDKGFYRNELDNEVHIQQNFLIFKNFINSTKFGG